MAKLMVVHDTDPTLFVEILTEEDEDGDLRWDGECSAPGCDYTVSEGGTWYRGMDEALSSAELHIDQHGCP